MAITKTETERNEFGRKMYLVLCLQRGMLDEALKIALKIQEKIPHDKTIQELIRYSDAKENR